MQIQKKCLSHIVRNCPICVSIYTSLHVVVLQEVVYSSLSDKASACTISMWFILQRFQKPPILHSYRESESRIFYQWLGFKIEIHLLNKNLLLLNLFWNVMFYILLSKIKLLHLLGQPPPPPFAVHLHEIFDSCIENESMFNILKKKCTTLFNFLL